jgi:hypothetical protein
MDPNFSFQLNVAGVQAAGGGKALDEGYYKGTFVDAYTAQNSNGGHRLVLKIGNFEGFGNAVRTTSITIPNENTKTGLLNVWRAAMESAAYTDAQIGNGAVTIERGTFVDRPAHIYYKPGDRDAGIYDEIKLISPETWAAQKTSFEASSTSAVGAAAVPAAGGRSTGAALGGPAQTLGGPAQTLGGSAQTLGGPTNGVAPAGQTPASLRAALGMN